MLNLSRKLARKPSRILLAGLLCCLPLTAAAQVSETIHHDLQVSLDPATGEIEVLDSITLPPSLAGSPAEFRLNSNLEVAPGEASPRSASGLPAGILLNTMSGEVAPTSAYQVETDDDGVFTVGYRGRIAQDVAQQGAEYAQSFSETTGIIDTRGVYLSKASYWVPDFGDHLVSFDLRVEFADSARDWLAVSQGDRNGPNGWSSRDPMEEIYLIAAQFTEYSQMAGDIEALAYLRTPDSNLAIRYLDATERYLQLYEPLLGDYPFSKFALVENFWETGYGMPSFTLLGSQVIRFPFILESSYPHELLHNWWGNGVYPDYESGNWSEGLTTYLADHLFREMDGRGAEYRKDMLARYRNYVAEETDFPLTEFTTRNSAASQAVGYGKTLMLWHMLRGELGDDLFLEGLRRLYDDYLFQRIGFTGIAELFSEVAGFDLGPFFAQWVNRTGAPDITVSVDEVGNNQAQILFAQIHNGEPYELNVPLALYYAGREEPEIHLVRLTQKLEGVVAPDYDRLEAVLVDPWFDLFRKLDREETPPTVGEMFGAREIAFLLPRENREEWRRLAEAFAADVDARILTEESMSALPPDRSVWVLGRDNPFAEAALTAAGAYGAAANAEDIVLAGQPLPFADRSTVLIGRHPANPELAIGLIHVDGMAAMPGMIEKLPHYGRYSYLSFYGEEPTNDVSGVWNSPDSPMQWLRPDLAAAPAFSLPPLESLAELPPKYLPGQFLRHAEYLTSPEREGRGIGSRGLEEAAFYIADQFRAAGLQPLDGAFLHGWRESIDGTGAGAGEVELANVVGLLPGVNPALSTQPIVIGAHYDHVGIEGGEIHPGADDNASGVAVLIETATKLARSFSPQRPIIFAAFTAEESGLIGSRRFLREPPGGYSDFFAMINLDSVGRLEGRTLQVFGTESAYEWPFMAQGIGFTIGVQSEFPAAAIASGDHASFLEAGIPAIHLFAGTHPDFHRPSDTADKLDTAGMSDIALWLEEAVVYLGGRTEPFRVTLENAPTIQTPAQGAGPRRAALGVVPDFGWTGEGVRVDGVTPGSAGETAGLQANDILLRFNGEVVEDLQTYSNLLREVEPGDSVRLEIRRQRQLLQLEAVLGER
ncbi:MAG: M20/M25/M40 family metallo-hydrolase [Gammaproteobacteria bacterium]|nr:M20/M25/M40 family metallo-hydrolase [Gammaproteobacteria bacterium]MYH85837.1 M20/M25/M40 family metallo-hydrolase [Gammaproteobacteria bacterium]MYK05349.1 M20/M25/M40 family metallo-hydrolase [Gammaproteobacteria bacterium]